LPKRAFRDQRLSRRFQAPRGLGWSGGGEEGNSVAFRENGQRGQIVGASSWQKEGGGTSCGPAINGIGGVSVKEGMRGPGQRRVQKFEREKAREPPSVRYTVRMGNPKKAKGGGSSQQEFIVDALGILE